MNLVLKSACIYDSVGKKPFAGYIEIEGNRIKSITAGETKKYDDHYKYQFIDCGSRTITPGLCDSHVHLFLGALNHASINLYDSRSEEEAARQLYEFYQDRDDPWILAFGWSHFRWPLEKLPKRDSLDQYFPDKPVIAFNDELHAVWVNSKTLSLCNINKNTPDPVGGTIERDGAGEPTGFLLEQPAMEMVTKKALQVSEEKEESLISGFIKLAHQRGITSIGAVHVLKIMKHKACARLEQKGELKLRVFFAPHMEMELPEILKLKETYCSDTLKFLGVKGFVDGTPLGYTGFLVEPYADRPGFFSEPLVEPDWLIAKSKELYKNNIAMRLHACGDGAVRLALQAFGEAQKEYGKKDVRNTIEHIEVLHRDDIGKFAETNTIASIQPSHMIMESLDRHPIFSILDEERLKLAWPGKTLEKNGAVVAFGTDYPIVELDPVDSIYRAVKRVMEDDLPEAGWNPQEKFTITEAIKNSTIGPAYMMGMEDKIGSLQEGKFADINVFNKNIFECEDALPSIKTYMTIFNGEIVYQQDYKCV